MYPDPNTIGVFSILLIESFQFEYMLKRTTCIICLQMLSMLLHCYHKFVSSFVLLDINNLIEADHVCIVVMETHILNHNNPIDKNYHVSHYIIVWFLFHCQKNITSVCNIFDVLEALVGRTKRKSRMNYFLVLLNIRTYLHFQLLMLKTWYV